RSGVGGDHGDVPMRALVIVLLAGCSAATEPFEPEEDRPVFQEPVDLGALLSCTKAAHVSFPSGGCLMERGCADAGLVVLTCAQADGGVSCACAAEKLSYVPFAPSSCADEAVVTDFARQRCGWSWL